MLIPNRILLACWISTCFICIYGEKRSRLCIVSTGHMTCNETIPETIPKNVTDVEVRNIASSFNARNLSDSTWSTVTRLVLAETRSDVYYIGRIDSGTFKTLVKVEYLKLEFFSVWFLGNDTFVGLLSLRYLVLSNFWRLTPRYVLAMFYNNQSFPKLVSLQIDSLNRYAFAPLYVNTTFYKAIALRNISELVLHTPIFIMDVPSDSAPSNLQKLDLSYSHIQTFGNIINPLSKSVRYMDISGVTSPSPGEGLQLSNKTINVPFQRFVFDDLRRLTTIKGDNQITLSATILINVTFIFNKEVKFGIKHVSGQGNMLQYIDCDVVAPPDTFARLDTLELQDNDMEYFKTELLLYVQNLVFLNISKNKFENMRQRHSMRFAKLTVYLQSLRVLDLSQNGLTTISLKMFEKNRNLKELYLRNNSLKQFCLHAVLNLTVLDLYGNEIRYLNSQSMAWLQNVYDQSYDKSFKVNLMGNPLQCTCEAVSFLKWFIASKMFHYRDSFYSCKQDGNTKSLTKGTVDDLISDCTRLERLRLYLLSTIVPTSLILVVAIAMFCAIRRFRNSRKRLEILNENINQIRTRSHKYKYPVFLSYSSADGDFVLDKIYGPLLGGLRVGIGTEADLICVGDLHFKPGYSVHEEVIRCLEMSGVFVSIISADYCRSSYCRTEFERAYSMGKPILQMYKDRVDEETMWPFLRKTFKLYTRIQVIMINNEVEFHPDVETICTSILEQM